MGSVRCQLAAIRCEKGDVAGNLAAHLELVADAAAAGCQLALFPEMSLTGSANPAVSPEHLIPLDHPTIAKLAGASGQNGVGVCFGVAERAPPTICGQRAGQPRGPGRKKIAPGRGGLSA